MKDAYYKSVHCNHEQLFLSADNIRPGRTQDGLLFQVMFDLGIPLSGKTDEKETVDKKKFSVENGRFSKNTMI